MQLAEACFRAVRVLPQSERYGLGDQIRRAAASIPANIAEGHGRIGRKDFRRFVSIASGSRNELETYLLLTRHMGFLKEATADELLGLCTRVGQMLTALRKAL